MTELDPEILFAAALGTTLAKMRAELDETAIKRILTFVLDRYGVVHGQLYVNTMPKARIIARPAVQDVFPEQAPSPDPEPPATIEATNRAACPICDYRTITTKGLGLHMYHKHGTTMKEYQRQKALDEAQP